MASARDTARRNLPALAALAFLASQAGYRLMGLRFDVRPLDWFMQYLDPVLLRTRLLESAFYLHSQPPLFNLFLGLVLRLFPTAWPAAFQSVFLLLGVLLAASLVRLQLRLGVPAGVAFALAVLFCCGPAFALYANWLFYTFPDALLLVLSALALHAFMETGRFRHALAFFSLLAALALVRSLFHLGWLLLLAAGLALLAGRYRRRVILAACGPLAVVVALYAKNLAVFGRFAASTWLGMNVWAVVTADLPLPQRQAMVEAGELSPVAVIDRFSAVEDYPAAFDRPGFHPSVPALHRTWKTTHYPNFNHIAYVAAADAYWHDALAIIRHRPAALLKGLAKSWFAYFKASSDYVLLAPNSDRIAPVVRAYDVLQGRLPVDLARTGFLPVRSNRGQYAYVLLFAGLLSAFIYGLVASVRGLRSGSADAARWVTVLYLCATVFYAACAGNLLEAGENHRFRFETDPLSLALLGLLAARLLRRRGARV